jgi:hypothetical protein
MTMAHELNDVRVALARAVGDDVGEAAAKQMATLKHQIRGINVCERGI